MADEVSPAIGFRTRALSALGLLSREGRWVARLLPAFGPSWGTGYPSSVFRLPLNPVHSQPECRGDKRFGGRFGSRAWPYDPLPDSRAHNHRTDGNMAALGHNASRTKVGQRHELKNGLAPPDWHPRAASLSALYDEA